MIAVMSTRVIIGTAGHVDHGKSSLVRALTGVDPDRLKEEKERGITIELGFARLDLPSGTVAGIVDVPGHERFVRTMVAGAAGIDLVVLVVAADEGVMPQTREHLDICRLLSVRHGLVALTKVDRVEPEWAALQADEVRRFVAGTFLDGAPVLPVSSLTGEGIPALVEALDALASRLPGKDPASLFRLPVDRSFTMKGFGTVVTGTLVGGTLATGEDVAILPGRRTAKVRGLQVHGAAADRATAGMRTAVNLQGVERDEAPRGSVLAHPGVFSPTRAAEVHLEYLALCPKPLPNRGRVYFHSGTRACPGRILLYGATEIRPGGSGYGRLELAEEQVLACGDRFVLRGFTPLSDFGYTVGGGVVLSPHPPVRKGAGKACPPTLPRLRSEEPYERLLAAFEDAGAAGLVAAEAAVRIGTGAAVASELCARGEREGVLRAAPGGGRRWHGTVVAATAARGKEALAALHDRFPDRAGFPRDEVTAAFRPPSPDPVLVELALAADPGAAKEGEFHYLPERRPKARPVETASAKAVLALVEKAALLGPTRGEIGAALPSIAPAEVDRAVEGLVRGGAILRIKDLHFLPAAVETVRGMLVKWITEHGEISVADFKELTGLTRKYLIPLLEHFDATKVTLRVGEKRILRKSGG
jgi:selenocysteine-specific elongation factor